jgi:hypothetical protein
MSSLEDEILARELGKVGGIAGPGGSAGASIAAKFLPTETFRATLRIERDAREVLESAFRVLAGMGQITDEFSEPSSPPGISAIVGSGFLKMNPALIHVQVASAGEHASSVSITAAGKEGLIKQGTAEKAVGRFTNGLLKTYA